MRNKQQSLKLILVGAAICGFPSAAAWARLASVPSELSVNSPSEVLMVDGADRHSDDIIKSWLDTPDRAMFDFGFMDQGGHDPVMGPSHDKGSDTFAGGPDGLRGTPDDQTDRRFDIAGDAHEGWDGHRDDDGMPDAHKWFKNKRSWCPGKIPTPTAVPLPGSLLFFGSGLLGLAATLRGLRRT